MTTHNWFTDQDDAWETYEEATPTEVAIVVVFICTLGISLMSVMVWLLYHARGV